MAGSGGGSHNFGKRGSTGAGGSGGESSCSEIRFNTILQSPKPPASLLRTGDVLRVELHDSTTVVAIDSAGQIVGVILPSNVLDLVNCLQGGTEYEAKVQGSKGGATEVFVYAK